MSDRLNTIDNNTLTRDRQHVVSCALREDIGTGDITAELVPEKTQYLARVITREAAVICGTAWVDETFRQVDDSVQLHWQVSEGEKVTANQTLFEAHGNARAILTAERTALNFLQLLSGTATTASHYAAAVAGTDTRVLDTRKTLPGLRTAQKHAVRCGGCHNHRIGLYDAYLIKENHIVACGSIDQAISQARLSHPTRPVEVEVETLDEFAQALKAKADIIMLDEFALEDMLTAVSINQNSPTHRAKIEASGSITLENIREIAQTGVDYISIGSITKHLCAIDLSMRFQALN